MDEKKIGGRRYPWLEWFSKEKLILYKGEDYNGSDHGFSQYIRRAAKRYGYSISLTIGMGRIIIDVTGKKEPEPEVHNNQYRKK